ncbi:site-specific integrase [Methylibium sp.]|uniref:tyrosine-type recombinase/integrase n=1 Tax=Methylibium sp. TaxID=2067992 RepID=UPI0017D84D70|nr:site-specific integrase [Methylibium sp.]MBA3588318.1 site-specific integrase [Methylibium sp.]
MSIYRDPQGSCWVFEFDRRINGQRVRTRRRLPSTWNRTQADAFDRRESARLYGIATGERERFSLDQAVARYLTERAPALKHGLGVARELDLLSPYFTGRPMDDLPDVCAKYTADHRSALAPATIRNRLRYLTAAARWGWKHHNMGESDPAARVVMPAVSNERQVYVDRAQMLALARACRQWETRAMIRVAFYSGMRYSEIVAADVTGGHFLLQDTKNGEPRIVPIHPRIRPLLGYVWPEHETMSYWFRRAREAVGMPGLRFHDLRHSTASAMLNAGVPLFTVGAVLGHKSHASTKRYAHHATAALTAAVGKIGRKAG